jgi:SAM-dependent methyltransferase
MTGGAIYDTIGRGYRDIRRPDPGIASAIRTALGDASSVVNGGAGTGSYEPADRELIAIEPSAVMISQRPAGAAPAVQATAEALPLQDHSFDAAMALLTLQHWEDVEPGLGEMLRVARRRIVLATMDVEVLGDLWVIRDYGHLRRQTELDVGLRLVSAQLSDCLGGSCPRRPAGPTPNAL